MPGLIDAHWHAMLIALPPADTITGDVGYSNLVAADEAKATLLRGFTTVRDVGGPVFGLKRAIDEGYYTGPRIYPSGAMITVTSGHGDFRSLSDLPAKSAGHRRAASRSAALRSPTVPTRSGFESASSSCRGHPRSS
ncbi:amidohydrolase family protein [Sphingomonas daechungensis]|uniref:amidohydrolase family protein n=1 Tax=Sphingomonas daechungensis TaxID=1176646 RepID=UPI0021D5369D|nr:amidohydrolase family protein [Sphingomonas daechungensis]